MSDNWKSICLLILCLYTGISVASEFLPFSNTWDRSIRSLISQNINQTDILKELNRINSSVEFQYSGNTPFSYKNQTDEIDWENWKTRFSIATPFDVNNQHFLLKLESNLNGTDIGLNYNKNSDFSLEERITSEQIIFAHHYKELQLKWGVNLRFVIRDGKTRTEPGAEIGWGDVSNVRFHVKVATSSIEEKYDWDYNGNKIKGEFNSHIELLKYGIIFGERFGPQVEITNYEENYKRYPNSPQSGFRMNRTGTKRTTSLFIRDESNLELTWIIGGEYSNFPNEITIHSDGIKTIHSPVSNQDSNIWGIHFAGNFKENYTWKLASDYFQRTNSVEGLLVPEFFPNTFESVFTGDSYFNLNGKLKGVLFNSGCGMRLENNQLELNAGYARINTDIISNDRPIDSGNPLRKKQFPIKNLGLGWISLNGRFAIYRFNIGVDISQGFILNTEYQENKNVLDGDVSGGRLINVHISKFF